MKTNIKLKQLFLNYFRASERQIHWASLALTLCLFGSLLPAQGQDPILNPKYPMDTNVSVGATVSFRIYASSTNLPMKYQWQHEGTDLPSATNVTLVITNVTVAHAGGYMATVWNASGESTNTRTATLTVDPTFTQIMTGVLVTDTAGGWHGSWVDYNGDGNLDFSAAPSGGLTEATRMYHNEGNGMFRKVTTNAIAQTAVQSYTHVWGDYDNDGKVDLFVPNTGTMNDMLFHNNGNGSFTRVTTGHPLIDGANSITGAWGDYDRDGLLDLFVITAGCPGQKDILYRNNADGTFRKMTAAEAGPIVSDPGASDITVWADVDNDGWPELCRNHYKNNCAGSGSWTNQVYHLDSQGKFYHLMDVGEMKSATEGYASFTWADYDNDGFLDALVGAERGLLGLYRNLSGQGFTNVAASAFPSPITNCFAWLAVDYDNDGWQDLLFNNWGTWLPVLYRNNGDGTFTRKDVGGPTSTPGELCWGDYNNDGFLDILVIYNPGVRNSLYRHNGNSNHWLKVKLDGRASNRSGIGAKVRVNATIGGTNFWQMREISGQGIGMDNGLIAHFGLGDATKVDTLRIEWPSGNVQELTDVTPDRLLTLTEPTPISPSRPSASLNGSVTLTRSVLASASYQWQFNGVDLAGQTNRTLNLTNIVAGQEGHYSVVASNATTITTNFVYVLVDTTFSKITEGPQVTDLGCSMDAEWGDYDGDGLADLWVSRYQLGKSAVYRNKGDGTFERAANFPFGQAGNEWGLWADFDNDGRLDLLPHKLTGSTHKVSLYSNNGDGIFTPSPMEVVPNWWNRSVVDYNRDGLLDFYYSAADVGLNRLYRNNGDRNFTRMTAPDAGPLVGVLTWGGVCWGDFDDDGWPDLFVPSFRNSKSLMFRSDGTGRFAAVANLVTKTAGPAIAGAWGDYDNDGRLDLCVADLWGGRTLAYRNLGNGDFDHPAGTPDLPGNHNFAAWADYDNDGFLDLFLSGGNTANVLFHNNGDGSFTQVRTGSIANERPLGGSDTYNGLWFDYDNDGFLDLYVVNGNDAASINTANFLYHNNGNSNAWLKVRLIGTASNRDGVGAKVRALATYAGQSRWQRRDISGGDVHNGNQLYAHFGLGNATKVTTLRIEWPSGTVQEFANVATNQFLTLWEPPTISAAVREDGACELSITAEPNRGWQIQASGDLLTWQTLTTLTSTTATMYFIDTAAAGMDCRFYRVESK